VTYLLQILQFLYPPVFEAPLAVTQFEFPTAIRSRKTRILGLSGIKEFQWHV